MQKYLLLLLTLISFNVYCQNLVQNIAPGLNEFNPSGITPFKNGLIFSGDDSFNGTELYFLDSSTNNINQLTNFYQSSIYSNDFCAGIDYSGNMWGIGYSFVQIDSLGYFVGRSSQNDNDYYLFKTDGTSFGTDTISGKFQPPSNGIRTLIFKMDNKVCAYLFDNYTQQELLYVHDPISKTTFNITCSNFDGTLITEEREPITSSHYRIIIPHVVNNKIYKAASNFSLDTDYILSCDIYGQVDTVFSIAGSYGLFGGVGYASFEKIIINDKLLFYDQTWNTPSIGHELYSFDFATNSLSLIKDVNPYFNYSSEITFFSFPYYDSTSHTKAFFTAQHEDYGVELWVTDGTAAGTKLVEDRTLGPNSTYSWSSFAMYPFYNGDTLLSFSKFFKTDGDNVYDISDFSGIAATLNPPNPRHAWNIGANTYVLYGNQMVAFSDTVAVSIDSINSLSCSNGSWAWPDLATEARGTVMNLGCNLFFNYNDCDYTGSELFFIENYCAANELLGEEEFKATYYNLYPNPTSDIIYITKSKQIKIYNAMGELVFSQNNLGGKSIINVSHLSKGIYFVQLDHSQQKMIKI